eukprot:4926675-Amphidinium_carterae.1
MTKHATARPDLTTPITQKGKVKEAGSPRSPQSTSLAKKLALPEPKLQLAVIGKKGSESTKRQAEFKPKPPAKKLKA